jgi:hypothetical protein
LSQLLPHWVSRRFFVSAILSPDCRRIFRYEHIRNPPQSGLQSRGQACTTFARSRDLGSEPVMQLDAINPVTATPDAPDSAQVH